MGLKDIKLPTAEVLVPGSGSFTVRGLSFVDMQSLYVKYASEMAAFFTVLAQGANSRAVEIENAAALAADVITKAPALAADIIAVATGEDDAFELALSLPVSVQIEALTKIGPLTFGSEGGTKKFLQTVNLLIKSQNASLKS